MGIEARLIARPTSPAMRTGRRRRRSTQAPAGRALLEGSAIEGLSHHADPSRVLRVLSAVVEGLARGVVAGGAEHRRGRAAG